MTKLDVCRLCLDTAEGLGELTHRITHIISTCFSLKICLSPELTNKVCQACIDQLVNVYKYRRKLMRNEYILLKKLRKNKCNYSAKMSKDSQKESDIDVVNDNIVEFNIDEIDIDYDESVSNESNMAVNKEVTTQIVKQDKDTILENEVVNTKHKEIQQNIESNNMFRDFIEGEKDKDNFKTDEINNRVNELDEIIRYQHDTNLNIPVTTKIEIENFMQNNTLQGNELSSLLPSTFESDKDESSLGTDKENTDMNNLTINFTDNKNDSVIKKTEHADVILNEDKFYAFNTDKKYMCLTCLKVFESQKELSIHYKTVELSNAMKETSKKYTDLKMVKVSNNDGDKTGFKCDVCSKVFTSKASIMKHSQVHKVERPFLCNLCGRTYKSVDDILRHGVVHNGNKFVCSYECGYSTVHLGALRQHVKRHKKEYKYKCDKCDKCFQVKTWYDQHQNVHDKVRPFLCKICGQAFSMARYLTAHRANVHPQSSRVKRYKCVHCGLPCDSRKSLVMHMKQKHGMKTDCLCDVCGQILPDPQKLSLHKNVHEARRNYSCGYCKKTFNKKDHKTVHEKIHTGERLSCGRCPKTFTQRCSLQRHIKRYHPGDKQSLEQKT